ncbi:MAG TPA: Mur ligase family protein [Thermomicrobiales bacterium]|nr:Mur ligase family protein [Thermomicrobiales bacterium]
MSPELLERYHEAIDRLDALIASTPSRTDTSREAVRRRAAERMGRLRNFLAFLGDPAAAIPKIHIGGTSGKGSTTTALAAILSAAGYRTGAHTSPYLQVPSEKLHFDGDLIDAERFVRLVDHLLAALAEFPDADHITYGEAWIALVMLFLEDIGAEVGIIEVGAGGRFDLSNIVDPELAIITSVGIDHTNTLGDTIEQIAWHKAGIIKPGRLALSTVDDPRAQPFMREEAAAVGACLREVDMATAIRDIQLSDIETSWVEAATGQRWTIGMAGRFQARNGQAAREAARMLAQRGWRIADAAIDRGLRAARIPGRAERMPGEPRTMLDGAHNAQKVTALAADLPELLPVPEGARRIIVLGALEAKQVREALATLLPHADMLIATSPRVFGKEARAADDLAALAREVGFGDRALPIADPREALERARTVSKPGRADAILVTGSLYLVGNIRDLWYPADRIAMAGTPWPIDGAPGDMATTHAGARP